MVIMWMPMLIDGLRDITSRSADLRPWPRSSGQGCVSPPSTATGHPQLVTSDSQGWLPTDTGLSRAVVHSNAPLTSRESRAAILPFRAERRIRTRTWPVLESVAAASHQIRDFPSRDGHHDGLAWLCRYVYVDTCFDLTQPPAPTRGCVLDLAPGRVLWYRHPSLACRRASVPARPRVPLPHFGHSHGHQR